MHSLGRKETSHIIISYNHITVLPYLENHICLVVYDKVMKNFRASIASPKKYHLLNMHIVALISISVLLQANFI